MKLPKGSGKLSMSMTSVMSFEFLFEAYCSFMKISLGLAPMTGPTTPFLRGGLGGEQREHIRL